MLKVTVVSPELRKQPYTNKKTGQPAELFFQTAYVHTVDAKGLPAPFPEKIEFIAERDPQSQNPIAYAKGEYTLHPSAIYVDRDDRLAASMRLTPLPSGKS